MECTEQTNSKELLNKTQSKTSSQILFEQIDYKDDFDVLWKKNYNSTLRRALYCSFKTEDYFYLVGGYSFHKINFLSRLNLNSMKWEHSPDQNPSSIHNRSNRRFYTNLNYKQPTLNLPQSRYGHSCVLDQENVIINIHFYTYRKTPQACSETILVKNFLVPGPSCKSIVAKPP